MNLDDQEEKWQYEEAEIIFEEEHFLIRDENGNLVPADTNEHSLDPETFSDSKAREELEEDEYEYVPYYEDESPLSFYEWFWTVWVLLLPVIGFIVAIFWATRLEINLSKKRFARVFLCIAPVVTIAAVFLAWQAGILGDLQKSFLEKQALAKEHKAKAEELYTTYRDYQLKSGGILNAKVISVHGNTLTLETPDGAVASADIYSLRELDQAWIKERFVTVKKKGQKKQALKEEP